jgi:hypothetical protein
VIVTEEQARQLWCPQSRVPFLGAHVGNRVSSATLKMCEKQAAHGDPRDLEYVRQQVGDTKCIASACMFWRFVGYRKVASGNDEAHGCCGLAPDTGAPTGPA